MFCFGHAVWLNEAPNKLRNLSTLAIFLQELCQLGAVFAPLHLEIFQIFGAPSNPWCALFLFFIHEIVVIRVLLNQVIEQFHNALPLVSVMPLGGRQYHGPIS